MIQGSLYDMVIIVDRALNSVDNRLKNHGEQVAYVLMRLLSESGQYNSQEIVESCIAASLHDIGAYKVEEQRLLEEFEVKEPHAHAVYGYMFLKYFSPLPQVAKYVKYHHLPYKYRNQIKDANSEIPFLLHLADRICVLSATYDKWEPNFLHKFAPDIFKEEHVELFIAAEEKKSIIAALKDGSYKAAVKNFLVQRALTFKEIIAFAQMLVFAIDFRSTATVIHSVTVEVIAKKLAELKGITQIDVQIIALGALLHDIGKITVPVEILEKPGSLTKAEYEQMKQHVVASNKILGDMGFDKIKQIASLHHERLDGSGYPYGLKESEVSDFVQLVMVADVASALCYARSYRQGMSKHHVIEILEEMAADNKLSTHWVNLIAENFDEVIEAASAKAEEVYGIYEGMVKEYNAEYDFIKNLS